MSGDRIHVPDIYPTASQAEEVAHYWLRSGARELLLSGGELIVGRAATCQIVVNEPLVSRRHARIVMDGGCPYIEDLESANGTLVNQSRIHERTPLLPGDLILIGTSEIEVIRHVAKDPDSGIQARQDDRPTPSGGVGAFQPLSGFTSPISKEWAPAGLDAVRPEETTTKVDSLEYLCRLADKMFTMGRADAALKILSGELREILDNARKGRMLGDALLDLAGRYAVKLASETLDGAWVDLAIETHLLAVRPLREGTIQQLASLRAKAPLGSDALIARYYDRLRGSMALFSPADRMLCERVACLLPAL